MTLEVVDKNVSVTKPDSGETRESDSYAKIPKPTDKRPVNMSFEEGRVPRLLAYSRVAQFEL